MASPDDQRATRERVVLALIPTCSRHELRDPQHIVAIASELCKYIDETPESAQVAPESDGTPPLTQRGPKAVRK